MKRVRVSGKKDFGKSIRYSPILSFDGTIGLRKVRGGEGLLDTKGG